MDKSNIILKLINYQFNDAYNYIYEDQYKPINLKMIYLDFMNKGMNINNIKKVNFIHLAKRLDDLDLDLRCKNGKNSIIHIFSNDEEIKEELLNKIFTIIPESEHNLKQTIKLSTKLSNLPIEDDDEIMDKPSNDEIHTINLEIIKNFQDKDFVNLLKICIEKPHLLKLVKSYISHGDIVSQPDFSCDYNNDDNQFNYTESFEFLKLLINDMNIDISMDETNKILKHFNGHLNLSMRYIFNKYNIILNYSTNIDTNVI
uniref:Uncharacterized protein n=1 Tax=viral metagenome TaxID=1070528 RepID=A0A6C0J8E0_9ZZZZ